MSSIEIERICNAVDENILETAAIGVPPAEGGPEQLIIAAVLKEPVPDMDKLRIAFNSAVQKRLNPLFRVPISALHSHALNLLCYQLCYLCTN